MEIKRYHQILEFAPDHWWYVGRKYLLENLVKRIPMTKSDRILDVGCGTGDNLKLLSKFGQTYGVDTEPTAVKICQSKKLRNIFLIKPGSQLPFPNRYFKLVTCLDVLEHVTNDQKLLKELQRVTKPDGKIIIFVPMFPLLWSDLDKVSHHLRRYLKADLLLKANQASLKVEDLQYFNYLFFLPILTIRLFQRILPHPASWGVDPVIKSHRVNSFLTKIFLLEISSLNFFHPPFGVSLLLVLSPTIKPGTKHH